MTPAAPPRAPLAAPALRGLARRPLPPATVPAAEERCDVCAQPVPEQHRHLLDPAADTLLCACQACALLFTADIPGTAGIPGTTGTAGTAATAAPAGPVAAGDREAPGGRPARGPRYRLIPQRRLRLAGTVIDDLGWAALRVPVTLAFFVVAAPPGDGVEAGYPSALGVTRATVDRAVWDAITARHPVLGGLAPGTEALLADRSGGRREHWIVPLDDCYRLAAVLRTQWRGFTGGAEAEEQVRRFLAGLDPSAPDTRSSQTTDGEGKAHG
ncbi:hypothetical protein GCM10018793_60160 [Streptomyces sulfonofaciens]|uniref:Uncharacterized protein n=1 Tax=Streptomyces sulfonofaciens TaxID=68272 RepID=A0A919GMT9_9ACTN|nr:DUF5947 family protein [Streptomyces sulfonofaciens]GHH86806.1 hypothetical protein GCM10018793_60160 [Streptomyces sulfonofaciens]